LGPDLISLGFGDDGTRIGSVLRGHGQEKKRIKYVDAMFYVLGHCQRIMGSLCL
jgi:hypothetical protein